MPSMLSLSRPFRRFFTKVKASPTSTADDSQALYPVFPPPPPRDLINQHDHYRDIIRKRSFAAPEGETEDKPLFVLYRLYEHIVLDNNIGMRNEIEAFWWTKIPVLEIPDPHDEAEPERYAVLSCIPALLVESFNERLDMGLRREAHSFMSQEEREAWAATPKNLEVEPAWACKVPPTETVLHIPHNIAGETQLESFEDKRASAPFKMKNILIWHPHIHFI